MRRKKLTIRSFNPLFHGALGPLRFLSFVFGHVAGCIRVHVGAEYCEEVGLGWSLRTRDGGAMFMLMWMVGVLLSVMFVFTFVDIFEVLVLRERLAVVMLVCI